MKEANLDRFHSSILSNNNMDSEAQIIQPRLAMESGDAAALPSQQAQSEANPQSRSADPCLAYNSYDSSVDVESYNCSGLSFRDYTPRNMADAEAKIKNQSKTTIDCNKDCPADVPVHHTFWKFNLKMYDDLGRTDGKELSDFHTVASVNRKHTYSKNGRRPVQGPASSASFRPKAKSRARTNDKQNKPAVSNQGRPAYKHRYNITEQCYCLPCPKEKKSKQSHVGWGILGAIGLGTLAAILASD